MAFSTSRLISICTIMILGLIWAIFWLFGESYLVVPLISGTSIVLFVLGLFTWRKRNGLPGLQTISKQTTLVIATLSSCFLAYLILLATMVVFSPSIPIFIERYVRLAFSMVASWGGLWLLVTYFGRSSARKILVYAWLISSLMLSCMSIAFFFLPAYASLLPGMNVLHASFGHNHLAGVLIMIMPVAWWLVVVAQVNRENTPQQVPLNWMMLAVASVLSIMIAFSFGRVAVLLGFLELLVFWWLWIRNIHTNFVVKARKKIIQATQIFLVVLLVVFSFWLVFKTAMVGVYALNDNFACPWPKYKTWFCKDITQEPRLKYWEQAFLAISDRPLTGHGFGMFQLVNSKYRQLPNEYVAGFAHNYFLTIMSEVGVIVGGAFSLLMIVLVVPVVGYLANRIRFPSEFSNEKTQAVFWLDAVSIAIVASYINALFDFDWHFTANLMVTLLLLGLFYIERPRDLVMLQFFRIRKIGAVQNALLFFMAVLAVPGLIYFSSEIFISQGKINQAFSLFPYFHSQKLLFENSTELSDDNRQRLYQVYKNHPEMIIQHIDFLEQQTEMIAGNQDYIKQKIGLEEHLFTLDPWRYSRHTIIDQYLELGEYELAYRALKKQYEYLHLLQEKDQDIAEKFLFVRKLNASQPKIINWLIAEYRFEDISYLIGELYRYEPWKLLEIVDQIAWEGLPAPVFLDIMKDLPSVSSEYVSTEEQTLIWAYQNALLSSVRSESSIDWEFHLQRILSLAPWQWLDLNRKLYSLFEADTAIYLAPSDGSLLQPNQVTTLSPQQLAQYQDATKNYWLDRNVVVFSRKNAYWFQIHTALQQASSILQNQGESDKVVAEEWEEKLARLLAFEHTSQAVLEKKLDFVTWEKAISVRGWVFRQIPAWIILPIADEISYEEATNFFGHFEQINTETTGWNVANTHDYLFALQAEAIRRRDRDVFTKLQALHETDSTFQATDFFDQYLVFISSIQSLLEAGEYAFASNVADTQLVFDEYYWLQLVPPLVRWELWLSQPTSENLQNTITAFKACVDTYTPAEHDECQYMYERLANAKNMSEINDIKPFFEKRLAEVTRIITSE